MEEEQQQVKKEEEQQQESTFNNNNVVDFSSLESKLDALLKLNEKIYTSDEKERQKIQIEKDEQQKQNELKLKEQDNKNKESATLDLKNTSKVELKEKLLSDDTNKFREDVLLRFDSIIKQNNEMILLNKLDFVFSSVIIAVLLILILSNTCFKK